MSQGHDGCVRALLERGADKQALDPGFSTPLHLAVEAGHLGTVRAYVLVSGDRHCCKRALGLNLYGVGRLIEAGALLDAPDQIGDTALHTAAYAYVLREYFFFRWY